MISLPLLTIGQTANGDTANQTDNITIEQTVTEQNETKTVLSTAAKAEVNDLSYKKSNELISINAYKKSLQIKVKEIKNC